MISSNLFDYSDAYVLVKETITAEKAGTAADPNNRNRKVIVKYYATFTDCISEISSKDLDDLKKH